MTTCVSEFDSTKNERLFFCWLAELVHGRDRYRHNWSFNLKSTNATGSESLTELLDGLILLYHVGVHKHYLKVILCDFCASLVFDYLGCGSHR